MSRFRKMLTIRVRYVVLVFALTLSGFPVAPANATDTAFLIASVVSQHGTGHDRTTDLALDADGNAWISGVVGSYDFPGLSTSTLTNGGMGLRFVARIDALRVTPTFVAAVGAPTAAPDDARSRRFTSDEARGLAVDASGNAYLVAYDGTRDYPVTGGVYQATTDRKHVFRVGPTGVVTRLSTALDPAIRRVGAIALDPAGNIYLTGSAGHGLVTTGGAAFPMSSVAVGCVAPYVTRLDPSGQQVLYATYLGAAGVAGQACGNGSSSHFDPTGFALAVDALGNAYVTGQAEPGLAATAGAVNRGPTSPTIYAGDGPLMSTASHVFVAKLNSTGSALVWAARLGGSGWDRGTGIAVDHAGAVYVGGKTSSRDFPLQGAFGGFPWVVPECMIATPEVGFVAKLTPDGRQIVFSGYVPADGGQLDNCGRDNEFSPLRIVLDGVGNVVVAGRTDLVTRDVKPSSNALEPNQSGGQLLQVLRADGRSVAYSTSFAGTGVQAMARDRWGHVLVVDRSGTLQRLAPQWLPLDVEVEPVPACADRALTVTSRVAAAYDTGTVAFHVDGAVVGTSAVRDNEARVSIAAAPGVRQLRASYTGPGHFDGYASHDILLPVNQAGTCP